MGGSDSDSYSLEQSDLDSLSSVRSDVETPPTEPEGPPSEESVGPSPGALPEPSPQASVEPPPVDSDVASAVEFCPVPELASLIWPDEEDGTPASPRAVWERVVSGNARLPGEAHGSVSVEAALNAARRGDWGMAAYIAARCFVDAGGGEAGAKALAKEDSRAQDALWLLAAAPIVVEVPRGGERLLVHLDGCQEPEWISTSLIDEMLLPTNGRKGRTGRGGHKLRVKVAGRGGGELPRGLLRSADRLRVGEVVELSHAQYAGWRLWHLPLADREKLAVRALTTLSSTAIPFCCADASSGGGRRFIEKYEFLGKRATKHLASGRYHVLAYPLGGDLTRALLRPTAKNWERGRRRAVCGLASALGETLLEQCVKGKCWDLVVSLLHAGVPCPDMETEFASVCGGHPLARKSWCQDLCSTTSRAAARWHLSLLEHVARADTVEPFREVLAALKGRGSRAEVAGVSSSTGQCLLLALANERRWDALRALLEDAERGSITVAPLASSPALAAAPRDILEAIHGLASAERVHGRRARTLKEYFERAMGGESMDASLAPATVREDPVGILAVNSCGAMVLGKGLRAKGCTGREAAELVFLEVSPDEMLSALASSSSAWPEPLSLALQWRGASNAEPCRRREMVRDPDSPGCWLGIALPAQLVRPTRCGDVVLADQSVKSVLVQVPPVTIQVTTASPCCKKPLANVLIHLDGRRAGVTDHLGSLRLALPPGRYVFSAPDDARASKEIELRQDRTSKLHRIALSLDGAITLFTQDMTLSADDLDECSKVTPEDWVMMTPNRQQIPFGASLFDGRACFRPAEVKELPQSGANRRAAESLPLAVRPGSNCVEVLKSLELRPHLETGSRFVSSLDDCMEWLDQFSGTNECALAALFSGTPLRVGKLVHPARWPEKASPLSGTTGLTLVGSSFTLPAPARGQPGFVSSGAPRQFAPQPCAPAPTKSPSSPAVLRGSAGAALRKRMARRRPSSGATTLSH